MSRIDEYRSTLRGMTSPWEPFLAEKSGLPGPRGNIELAQAVAEEAPATLLRRYSRHDDEYLAFCGTVGLGRLVAEGDGEAKRELHRLASDERWRVREAVAMALQRLGDVSEERLLEIVERWIADPSLLVRRAAIAGACEPRLLTRADSVARVLAVLDRATQGLVTCPVSEQHAEPFRVLRLALAYCWSVAVAAAPEAGFAHFSAWTATRDRNVRWVLRKNLTKTRMRKADPERCMALDVSLAD